MNYLNKLERKLGRYAIPNLSMWLIVGYAIGYMLYYVEMFTTLPILEFLMLDPAKVMHGQIWRLVTWVLMPPSYSNIFFYIIMMLLYYQLGSALERTWGTFRYNVYIFGGILFTAVGVMVTFFVLRAFGVAEAYMMGYAVSTYYINLSIFLAFAVCYPEMQLMLYFIIPVKIKWLAILYAVLVGVSFLQTGWTGRIVIVMSLMNFLVFFFSTRDYHRVSPSEIKRKRDFRTQSVQPKMRRSDGTIYKHKCAVCGRTELDDPTLEFRFCSKCDGNMEYCQEHLFTHQHVKRS
ncbi:MAG: hypothetical protein MSA09_00765 [Lachnospiraceae bacterium]|nr:hypothetical protein [Lachnospiraceae bacterium]MDD7179016.1 hypothetical protein [bacterium]MDY5516983.1 hypothetical protein [Lachnospiraceae bacterium]